jgi:TPR repeat protein
MMDYLLFFCYNFLDLIIKEWGKVRGGVIFIFCIAFLWGGSTLEKDFFSAIESGKLSQARMIARKGCDGGDLFACAMLGSFYEEGLGGVDANLSKAKALYHRACEGGEMRGCTNLGNLYALGKGVRQDYARAMEYYTAACRKEEAGGCFGLGMMYSRGNGVIRDGYRAFKLFQKACYFGMPLGCQAVREMTKEHGQNRGK